MPRFTCTSCRAGFYSAATLIDLADTACSECGSPVVARAPMSARARLDERAGQLVVRREVARARARVEAEAATGDFGYLVALH
jgi:hypothetical protein